MSGWAKKRFWKDATVEQNGNQFTIKLDGRGVKTPAKSDLLVPTQAMADAIAAEWQAQEGEIAPLSMPVTRSANAAIDKVAHQHSEVADMLAEYGGSDLLCYRATQPEALIARQAAAWDPLLDWADSTLGARLKTVSGIMHEAQDQGALTVLKRRVHVFSNFELAAFHDLVALSGSLVLGFAAVHGLRPIEEIWTLSRVDENWQEEQWGHDDEASALAETKRQAFLHAEKFFQLVQK
ncbi:Chaperone required for the assembly of the F1-ATPase [Shimia gijangensis]|uniref:Chaperone required for the assembly of the F1-ATPase n=1 Tax=Shimia gijangensis TaxID=1470563 RepID=A0A1M6M584_9RHOB|nr:ATP12 family protein [Shimia gijangensis]SHJ78598.1 Chaperone required for the assembly of the F1-ATPase [Shimia gijangensis]